MPPPQGGLLRNRMPGSYTVNLTVTDADGHVAYAQFTEKVNEYEKSSDVDITFPLSVQE